ncbi:MAG: hypothetical protein HQL86_09280 [Magnetococcales bacterium]|nr:hypothetical protein [Magnetococcales bacterium]
MGISAPQLREFVVRPACMMLDAHSKEAEDFLMEIACQESLCGFFIVQKGGPALSPWQIEPATHTDIWTNFLAHRPRIRDRILFYRNAPIKDLEKFLITDLLYAALIARVFLLRIKDPIPKTRAARAAYWKKFYNTVHGKGSEAEYLTNAAEHLGPENLHV